MKDVFTAAMAIITLTFGAALGLVGIVAALFVAAGFTGGPIWLALWLWSV